MEINNPNLQCSSPGFFHRPQSPTVGACGTHSLGSCPVGGLSAPHVASMGPILLPSFLPQGQLPALGCLFTTMCPWRMPPAAVSWRRASQWLGSNPQGRGGVVFLGLFSWSHLWMFFRSELTLGLRTRDDRWRWTHSAGLVAQLLAFFCCRNFHSASNADYVKEERTLTVKIFFSEF